MKLAVSTRIKISILTGIAALTLAIHYGWVVEPIFGHVHWFHSLHGRFCYIPIVMAASWFGLRGGLYSATVISILVLPLVYAQVSDGGDFVANLVEIVFYYFIALLIGALVDREFFARRQQQKAEIQVERSQKLSLVGQMAAGVAHEIKNPLASIKGAADILVDTDTSGEEKEEFKEILHSEVRRIDNTVSEFLSFARPRETKLVAMDLSETIRACVRQVAAQARQSGISIENETEDSIFINGDSEKLHQMTLNLLLNAIQASQANDSIGINLSMNCEATAVLTISDSGASASQVDLDRAFEPFFTTKSSGTGLGLAIARSIVENHRGKISLKLRDDKGAVATVELPAWKEQG